MERQSVNQSSSDNDASMTEWQVERIQRHSVLRDAIYYHVVWKPTWESEDKLQHMLPDIIAWNTCHRYPESIRRPSNQFDPTLEHWSGKVIGRKEVDGLAYYKIQWEATMEPEANLENAKGLVRKYWDTFYKA
ncbi:Putative Chromo-like domain superfamily protein [Colletotrichum destructivum]|uniref:Chromo-like domain superfamily protein n=1 Tax=Colletotrichum destructivum TaxID=34406 RepID=A0AAX4I0G8_9PEZI|nr:Putative Chromo-like domain superfamily protein [Colletotrichum destructivum]